MTAVKQNTEAAKMPMRHICFTCSKTVWSTYRLCDDVLELVPHRVNHVHLLLGDCNLVLGQQTIRLLA